MQNSPPISIFWFRRDLRLYDSRGFYEALKSGLPVIAVFIFDKNILEKLPDRKDRRVDFIHQALAHLNGSVPVSLQVVGEGPLKSKMKSLARTLGVSDRVEFVGAVPWRRMPEYYRRADAFLFTSLRDSSGAVIPEAMVYRLPFLTLDHQGVGAIVPSEAAIKVPVTTPEETVRKLAEGIRLLAQSPELRRQMGEAGWVKAQTMRWQHNADLMTVCYEEAVTTYRVRQNGHAAA